MDEAEKAKLKRELRKLHNKKAGPKKSINFYLLMLIIVLLVALVAATFYFFWKYNSLVGENSDFVRNRNDLQTQLSQCTTGLDQAIDAMGMMSEELNISSASRASLNDLYKDLSAARSLLEIDLSATQTDLDTCNVNMNQARQELSTAIEELSDVIEELNAKELAFQTANTERDEAVALKDALEDDVRDLQVDLRGAERDLGDMEECINATNDSTCLACL